MIFAEAPFPRDQIQLIPVMLDELIGTNHTIRLLDELLGQLDWSVFEENYRIEDRGRPPIPPRVLTSAWVYAHFRRVRSSRELEYQLNNNIEFMWLAHGHQVDHSTLAKFRSSHAKEIKAINRQLISKAKDLGIVKLATLYIDGTRIKANSSRHNTMTAARASKLLELVESQIDEYLASTKNEDAVDDHFDGEANGERLPDHLSTLEKRKAELEAIRETCERADQQRKKNGINPEKNPFQLPLADKDSRVMPNKEGGYAPNYTPVVGVESEFGLIVSTIIINSPTEQDCAIGILDAVESDFNAKIDEICADTAYCTGSNINEIEEVRGLDFYSPHRQSDHITHNPAVRDDPTQPVPESEWDQLPKNPSTKRFSSAAFIHDEEKNKLHCPMGRTMEQCDKETRTLSNGEEVVSTRYQTDSCEGCAAIALCRTNVNAKAPRRVRRDQHATLREQHRKKMDTPEAKAAYAGRFSAGERPFGQLKEGFGIRRFQSRGINSINSELGLGQLAHNLLRMTNISKLIEAMRTSSTQTNANR